MSTTVFPSQTALRLGALGPMSPALRDRLGTSWSWRDAARFRALGLISRRLGPVLPESLRSTGPGQLRWRQKAIARGPLGGSAAVSAG